MVKAPNVASPPADRVNRKSSLQTLGPLHYDEKMEKRDRILSCRHWIFDLDGTLTLPVHDFALIRSELRIPDGADILGHLDSLSEHEALPLRKRLHEMETELLTRTAAATGADELLSRLASRGSRLGILTRNTRVTAISTLAAIGAEGYFDPSCIIGRDDSLPKPDPEGVEKLCSGWGTPPDEAVMVGDYFFDLQSGRAAGAATVHVDPTRTFRWPELADLMVVNLRELSELLD
jgi:HAD superfamily hydrolase (TIGR01509 family)